MFKRMMERLKQGKFSKKQIWLCASAGFLVVAVLTVGILCAVFLRPGEEGGANDAPEEVTTEVEKAPEKTSEEPTPEVEESETSAAPPEETPVATTPPASAAAQTANCTLKLGSLMLINPNFTVTTDFIAARRGELISLAATYGIPEYRASNGDNLMDAVAAEHLNEMLNAYAAENPGHTMGTRSCFRARGTNCGRLCLATGTSEHHSGYACDLIDNAYGTSLDTSLYDQHLEWQWLKANSYKYGFIDRYPEEWAGSSMDEPMNLTADGTTGLFETWHYRYVGVTAATEIATGKYNNGAYDSLEHYLLKTGRVADLLTARCE